MSFCRRFTRYHSTQNQEEHGQNPIATRWRQAATQLSHRGHRLAGSRDGAYIEAIGFYNPRTRPETVQIQEERALYWLSVGAQPTEAVARLLEKSGILARFARLKAGEPLEALVAEAAA